MTRRVIVTGANKGIGLAIVEGALAQHEDTFVYLGARDLGRGEQARSELVAQYPDWSSRLAVLPLDVADDASVAGAAAVVRSHAPGEARPLYGLVNNAGVGTELNPRQVMEVNTRGPRRTCEAFLPLIEEGGRVVNVSSASGPIFLAQCGPELRGALLDEATDEAHLDALLEDFLGAVERGADLEAAGYGEGSSYGMSKACLNAYTVALARAWPTRLVNACTPGFIETDMTRRFATGRGKTPAELGMKTPREGAYAPLALLFGDPGGSGWYFGSDAQRSPLDRYRAPGDPPYTG